MATLGVGYRQLSIAVKFSSVLFPFDTIQLLRTLSKQGFVLPEQISRPVTIGMRLEISGIVGRKGEVSVRVDEPRQVLGVSGPDTKSVLTEMDSLESTLKAELGFDSSSSAHYYEFLASLIMRANKNPLESWQSHFAQTPILRKISEVVGSEVSVFGLRVGSKGEVPNQANWFDIRIEPLVQSAKEHHSIEVVFRHSRRGEVIAFVRKFDDMLTAILSLVEKG